MAKKVTFKGVARRSVRGWGAVVAGGVLMTALAMLDAPDDGVPGATGSTGCQLQVTASEVTVRSGPSNTTEALATLKNGTIVDGTTEVTDGYRRLPGNRWVANEYLVPVTGSTC